MLNFFSKKFNNTHEPAEPAEPAPQVEPIVAIVDLEALRRARQQLNNDEQEKRVLLFGSNIKN